MNHILTARRMGLVLLATLLMLVAGACAGAQGPEGQAGYPGPVGPVGPQGAEGQSGQHGAPGQHGAQGADGLTGSQGSVGSQGPAGPAGPQGPAGVDGAIVTTGVTFTVLPQVMQWKRGRSDGAWFIGSGLEPGQWFNIDITAGGESVRAILFSNAQNDALRQANDNGAFALGLPVDSRDGRFLSAHVLDYSVITVTLSDQDTGEVLATAPWVLCDDKDTDIPLCSTAADLLPTGRVIRP